MIYIIKRDGRQVRFNKFKIVDAVLAAFKSVDGKISEYAEIKAGNIADYIQEYAESCGHDLTIEEIQTMVQNGLMSTKRKDVAEAYIVYRHERDVKRMKHNRMIKEVGEKLMATNIQNQNANVDEMSFGGRRGEAANTVMKEYALNYIMSDGARYNHINNIIYTHDLDSYAVGMHNCLTIPFDDLLANGFNTRQTDVRPANSINTAFQLVAVIFQLQSLQQFGGVSASHLDWTMVPYVRKSFFKHFKNNLSWFFTEKAYCGEYKEEIKILLFHKEVNKTEDIEIAFGKAKAVQYIFDNELSWEDSIEDNKYKEYRSVWLKTFEDTIKECQQAVEGMYHNLNTLQSRSGNQLPFTSINYGTCTLPEGRMVTKALLKGSIKGVGKFHKTSIFPCGIFQCMKYVNRKPGDPNYDLFRLALHSTSQRLYPNYANVDWSGNAGYDPEDPRTYFSTMGCRTANGFDINGLGQLKDGRGNIAPVTIILPTIAMMAKERFGEDFRYHDYVECFMEMLDKYIHEAKDQLIERFEWICSQPMESAKFMYENGTIAGYVPEEGIRSALKHGTLAIGQLGLAECLEILIGCDHTSREGMLLAKKIEKLFKDRCAEFKIEYHLNFGVYYTPAENLCYTAMTKFHQKWPEMFSDKTYFTNSIHVPVWKEITPFDKIDIESQLTGYSSAGCITYVELDGGVSNNLTALETLVNYAMDKDIPYFAINIPNDTCNDCGYTGEFNDVCPVCGSTYINHLRRVTGYLTGDYKTAFNLGKQDETEHRFRHSELMTKDSYMPNDFIDGEGVSVSFWVHGCPFRCEGCHNPEMWDFGGGPDIPSDIKGQLIKAISANNIVRNFSILGGEPLCDENKDLVNELISAVRMAYPNIKIFVWTGYTYEQLKEKNDEVINNILEKADVLIDGPFVLAERDITLPLRGSSNQRIIDLNKKI